jgi:hypothetical protein
LQVGVGQFGKSGHVRLTGDERRFTLNPRGRISVFARGPGMSAAKGRVTASESRGDVIINGRASRLLLQGTGEPVHPLFISNAKKAGGPLRATEPTSVLRSHRDSGKWGSRVWTDGTAERRKNFNRRCTPMPADGIESACIGG